MEAVTNRPELILEMERQRLCLLGAVGYVADADDDLRDALVRASDNLLPVILATPALTLEELLVKAEIWRQAGADDGDVPDHDRLAEHWPAFIADLRRLITPAEAQIAA
ncbi:MAG: hypothetical protein K0S56_1558 [Microvirga sp.]|jgi:hypothetical protein|nr:hypothetical protein [Microvirga sp.]